MKLRAAWEEIKANLPGHSYGEAAIQVMERMVQATEKREAYPPASEWPIHEVIRPDPVIVPEMIDATQDSLEQLAREYLSAGYRGVSHKYGLVVRIDREDWVEHLACHLRRAPADFYERPDCVRISWQWMDYYRRVLSQDRLGVGNSLYRMINRLKDQYEDGFLPKSKNMTKFT